MFDLGPAAQEMNRIVAGVRDEQLDQPTPCQEWTVADLLAHLYQFATVFAHNARKEPVDRPPGLPDDWRTTIPRQVDDLAQAWRDESAWTGRVSAGGVEMDAADNAVVAMEELVLHGWDLSRATGQDLRFDDASLDKVDRFREVFAAPIASGQGPWGAAVVVPDNAARCDRLLGAAGRDPAWSPR